MPPGSVLPGMRGLRVLALWGEVRRGMPVDGETPRAGSATEDASAKHSALAAPSCGALCCCQPSVFRGKSGGRAGTGRGGWGEGRGAGRGYARAGTVNRAGQRAAASG